MPCKDPERQRAYKAAYRAAHLEELRAYDNAYTAAHRNEREAYQAAHRKERSASQIRLAGERIRLNSLPEELRPLARLIQETRLEIRQRRTA